MSSVSYYAKNGLLISPQIPIGDFVLTFRSLDDTTLVGYSAENAVVMYFVDKSAQQVQVQVPSGIQVFCQSANTNTNTKQKQVETWIGANGESSFLLMFQNTYKIMWNDNQLLTFEPSQQTVGFDLNPNGLAASPPYKPVRV